MAGVRIPSLDIERIVAVFGGGPVACADACNSVGFWLEVTTIRKWLKRNSLPMNGWLMISRAWELTHGTLLDLNTFRKVAK